MKPIFSVIIPAYNEEEVLRASYERIDAVMRGIGEPYELLFIDDGSKDQTADILQKIAKENRAVRLLRFSRNFGHQIAVTAGLDAASGEAMIIIDCDLQDPPEVIPEMVAKWREGFDVVHGKRVKRQGETAFKKITAWAFYRAMQKMAGFPIPSDVGDFRLVSRRAADAVRAMPEHNRYLRGIFAWVGFSQTEVEYSRDKRYAGKTKYPFSKMLRLAMNGVLSFSTKLLDWIAVLGGMLVFAGALWLLILLLLLIFGKTGLELSALCALIVLMTGLILFSIGILGAYLGRVYDEVKGRPLYLIAERIGFDEGERGEGGELRVESSELRIES